MANLSQGAIAYMNWLGIKDNPYHQGSLEATRWNDEWLAQREVECDAGRRCYMESAIAQWNEQDKIAFRLQMVAVRGRAQ